MNTRNKATGSAEHSTLSIDEFTHRLGEALIAVGQGRPHILLSVEIARGDDIREVCGEGACEDLRQRTRSQLSELLDAGVPIMERNATAFNLLLADTSRKQASELAHRIHDQIEDSMFHWHGHPFRLGAHVGVLELGPQPDDPKAWLARAEEVSRSAGELGGSGVYLLAYRVHALQEMARALDWHTHITEVI